jgi:hypothetical protein
VLGLRVRLTLAVSMLLLLAPSAHAAPPSNDGPATPGAFESVTAENGVPFEQQAIAELAEATPDAGVPACLGSSSFARTVWFRIPESPAGRELTVEASGRTLAVLDLAAFVQPLGATGPAVAEPNQCAGAGAGGADASEEPASAVSLRIPPNRAVLIQVGRRGPVGAPSDETAVLTLAAANLGAIPQPAGDSAAGAPSMGVSATVGLGGATLSEEDPAQPPCPSTASVWRRIDPDRTGARTISADGRSVSTLTVHQGPVPSATNALDCVNRERSGMLAMRVRARRGRTLWVRLGTDRPSSSSSAQLRLSSADETIVDGGPGGSDPTPGGPGGGLPDTCARTRAVKARVTGRPLTGRAKQLSRRRALTLRVRLSGSSVCDVDARLFGPRGRVYAVAAAVRLNGTESLRLVRTRRLAKGRYRLVVRAIDAFGERRRITSRVQGRLR